MQWTMHERCNVRCNVRCDVRCLDNAMDDTVDDSMEPLIRNTKARSAKPEREARPRSRTALLRRWNSRLHAMLRAFWSIAIQPHRDEKIILCSARPCQPSHDHASHRTTMLSIARPCQPSHDHTSHRTTMLAIARPF